MSRSKHQVMKSRRSSVPTRKLLLQPLEPRLALAGNATASLIDGRLAIIGDDAANEVFVGDMGGGRFVVRGMTGTTGAPTTINGQSEVVIENVFGDVSVELGGGNDLFYLVAENAWNNGDPFAATWQTGGFAPLRTRHDFAKVYGELTVNLGNGNDTAVIAGSAAEGMRIEGGADDGDDGVFVRTAADRATSAFRMDLGQGNDYAALSLNTISNVISVSTAEGNDTLLMKVRADVDLYVNTGDGDDRLTMEGGAALSMGRLIPPVAFVNNATNSITVLTGAGNDTLQLDQLLASQLIIDSETGRDSVLVRGFDIRNNATIRGGSAQGSSIEVSNFSKNYPYSIDDYQGSMYPMAVVQIDAHIGGNLTVSFNYDGPIADTAGSAYSVQIGRNMDFFSSDFSVDGVIQVFGTIFDDDVQVELAKARSIQIDTGWGSDLIAVRGVEVLGDVRLLLGDGDDRGLTVSDYTLFRLINSVWADTHAYTPTHIWGGLHIDLGAGDDNDYELSSSSDNPLPRYPFGIGSMNSGLTNNFVVNGALTVVSGGGNDRFGVVAAKLGSADIRLEGERSYLEMSVFLVQGNLSIAGNAGIDYWSLTAFGVQGDMSLSSDAGDDWIQINQQMSLTSNTDGSLHIDSGSGNDTIHLGPSEWDLGKEIFVRKQILLETGEGNDSVDMRRIRATDLFLALLGTGDDQLTLNDVEFNSGLVDGGTGNDQAEGRYFQTTDGPGLRRNNFEADGLFQTNILLNVDPSIPVVSFDLDTPILN